MGSVARIAAIGSALTLAACAMIAGLDDPQTVSDATSAEGGSSSSSGSLQDTGNGSSSGGASSSGTPGSDAASDGAPVDAPPDVPQCTLLKNGDTCAQPSQCCSNKCNEKKQCANECKAQGTFNCDPTSTDDCCIGLWCNTGSCSGCIMSGQPAAEGIGGVRLSQSCCSRSLQNPPFGPNCQ